MTIAIDFGTERTKLAYPGEHGPALMQVGRDGAMHIPSLFYVAPDGGRHFGDDAADWLDEDPAGVVTTLKRKLHEPHLRVNRHRVPPTELIANLLGRLRERAERELPVFAGSRLERVVLTMPALFGPSDKILMENACRDAGFARVDFIPEPVAAARAWTLTPGEKTDVVVVFDGGGGTIDWACLRRQHGEYALVHEFPPGGNTRVGGHDVDRDILDHVADVLDGDAREEMGKRAAHYLAEARKYKERYCNSGVLPPFRAGKHTVEIPPESMDGLLRERFIEQATRDVADYVKKVRAGLNADVTLLMVGGGSRLKGLEDALRERTGCPVARWDQSDYAIVLGALAAAGPPAVARRNAAFRASASPSAARPYGLGEELRSQAIDHRALLLWHEHRFLSLWRMSDPLHRFSSALDRLLSAKDWDGLRCEAVGILPFTTARHFPPFGLYAPNIATRLADFMERVFGGELRAVYETHGDAADRSLLETRKEILHALQASLDAAQPAFQEVVRHWRVTGIPAFTRFEGRLWDAWNAEKGMAPFDILRAQQDKLGAFLRPVEAAFHRAFVELDPVWGAVVDATITQTIARRLDQAPLAKVLRSVVAREFKSHDAQALNATLASMDRDENASGERKKAVYDALRRVGRLVRDAHRAETGAPAERLRAAWETRAREIIGNLIARDFAWIPDEDLSDVRRIRVLRGYARGVAADEILALYDASVSGGDDNGYILLSSGVWIADEVCPSRKSMKGFPVSAQHGNDMPIPPGGLVPWSMIEEIDHVGTEWLLSLGDAFRNEPGGRILLLPCGATARTEPSVLRQLNELLQILRENATP